VQNIGWQDWVSDGELSGTSGKSLRLEAIQIKLTDEMAEQYDIYYRVHAQNYGWLDWAKNGAPAGTAGYSLRLEAIQIVLLPKGTKDSSMSTKRAYVDGRFSNTFYKKYSVKKSGLSASAFSSEIMKYADKLSGYNYGLYSTRFTPTEYTLDCISFVQLTMKLALKTARSSNPTANMRWRTVKYYSTSSSSSSIYIASWATTAKDIYGLCKPYSTNCRTWKAELTARGVESETIDIYKDGQWLFESEDGRDDLEFFFDSFDPGDIIFFTNSSGKVGHVGLYAGKVESEIYPGEYEHMIYDCSTDTGIASYRSLEQKLAAGSSQRKITVFKTT